MRQIMEDLAAGRLDPFLGFGELHKRYYSMIGIQEKLRGFFKTVDKSPCETFTVDDAFRKIVRETAADWLERY